MKKLITLGLTLLLGITLSTSLAQDYPTKPINVTVGWSAGGGVDTFTRIVAKYAPEYLGTDLVVTNKEGSGGEVALNGLVRGKADGYTLAAAMIPSLIYQPELRREGIDGYRTDDLIQLGTPVLVPSALHVPVDSPFQTLDDLITYAKENPGALIVGMTGTQSGGHGLLLMLEREADIDITEVPYKGGSAQVKAVLGGEIEVLNTNAMHSVQYPDELRTLAVAGEERYALAPDVPTFQEQGYDIVDYVSRGLVAPAGTPDEAVRTLREGFAAMAQDPEFQADLAEAGLALDYRNAEEMQTLISDFQSEQAWIFELFNAEQ